MIRPALTALLMDESPMANDNKTKRALDKRQTRTKPAPKISDADWVRLKAAYSLALNGKTVPLSMRSIYEGYMKALERGYTLTQNPLLAWAALRYYFAYRKVIRMERDENWEPWNGEMPAWLLKYFSDGADKIMEYKLPSQKPGADGRKEPGSGDVARFVSTALGFTAKGRNAFNDFRNLAEAQAVLKAFMEERDAGSSWSDAVAQAAEASGLDVRQALRKISKARKIAGEPTPPEDEE